MTSVTQKEDEKRDFESFARHYALPAGAIEYSDRPDVLIRGDRVLGVELANLHRADGGDPDSEQVQSIRRRNVIQAAQGQYLEEGGRNIELWVDFDPDHPIGEVRKTARTLAAIAHKVAAEGRYQSYRAFKESPEIRGLHHNGEEYADARWRSGQVYSVPGLLTQRVRELVAGKAEKARNYQRCDAYWLLLIVDFWDHSQDQEIDWPPDERLGATPFERVLLYKPAFGQVVEVPQ